MRDILLITPRGVVIPILQMDQRDEVTAIYPVVVFVVVDFAL